MKVPPPDPTRAGRTQAEQTRQRVRVGMIGLAAIVLLIGVASAIFSSVERDPARATPEIAANIAAPGVAPSPTPTNEPLAELGVTPAAGTTPAPAAP